MSNQDGRLELMSSKLNEYTELDDLVTIQAQLQDFEYSGAEDGDVEGVWGDGGDVAAG